MVLNVKPLVWVVVLHWRGVHHTRACLASLRLTHYDGFKVLLVDNGSGDSSSKDLLKQFPEITLLTLEKNQGFAGGCNAGIEYSISQGAQWIWILNNDTTVDATSLSNLMNTALQHPEAGALGAMVYTGSGDEYVASGRGKIDFYKAKTFLRAYEKEEPIDCEWISGSNLLLRATALKEVGFFDDDYFLYFEDTDLCYRLRKHGWSCVLVPSAHIKHIGSASTQGNMSYWRAYYYIRNRLLFFTRACRGISAVLPLLSIYGHILRHCLVLPWRGSSGQKQLRAELLGLRDFHQKHLGKATCLDWCTD